MDRRDVGVRERRQKFRQRRFTFRLLPRQVHLLCLSLEDLDGLHGYKPGLFISSRLVATADSDGAVQNLARLLFVSLVVDAADSALIPRSPDLKA